MEMHRSGAAGDWVRRAPGQHNVWQRLAARTGGIVTPGNVVSLAGLALVLWGVWLVADGERWRGVVAVGFGRLADLADGVVAERTGTKGPVGEAVDAGFDKICIAVVLVLFVAHHLLPFVPALLFGAQSAAVVTASLLASRRGIRLHPSRAGKLDGAAMWLAVLLFAAAKLLGEYHHHIFAVLVTFAASFVTAAALALGLRALAGYAKTIRRRV